MTFVLASQFHVGLTSISRTSNIRLTFVSSSNPQGEHVPQLPGAAHLPPPRAGVRGPGRGRGVQEPPPPRHPRPRHQHPGGGVLAEAGAAHTGGDQLGQLYRLFCCEYSPAHIGTTSWDAIYFILTSETFYFCTVFLLLASQLLICLCPWHIL